MLMEQLPARVYGGEQHVEDLQQALEQPLVQLAGCRDELLRQVRVTTADDRGLALWEKAYGLTSPPGRDVQWRRARVLAKMRGSATTTRAVLERMAAGFSPGGATVKELPEQYRLEITLRGSNGARETVEALMQAVEEVKPAHIKANLRLQQETIGQVHVAMRACVGNCIHVRPYQPERIQASGFIETIMHMKGAHRLHTYSKGE